MNTRPVTMLVVDDDEIDREGIKRALKKQRILNPIVEASDGEEALQILLSQHPQKKLQSPFLVLLDINMPRMSGLECLEEIRRHEPLRKSIVFILTTSQAEEEKARAYDLNVSGYLCKQNVGRDFRELIEMIDGFWNIVEFPDVDLHG